MCLINYLNIIYHPLRPRLFTVSLLSAKLVNMDDHPVTEKNILYHGCGYMLYYLVAN